MQFKNLAQFCAIALGVAGLTLGSGCGGSNSSPDGGTPGATLTFVIDQMDIGREDPPGTAPGFDLDMRNSDDADAAGCYQPDFISPDGTPGIDNQLAVLAPTIESAAGTNLSESIADSISGGSILILPILEDVNDNVNDPSVGLTLLLGEVPGGGTPALNPAGTLEAGQTFDISANSFDSTGAPLIHIASAAIVDGHLQAGPVDISLELPVMTNTLTLNIRNAIISFDLAADGSSIDNGLLGGELIIEELITAVIALSSTLPVDLVRNTLASVADLSPNAAGDCESLSVAMVLSGIPAMRGADAPAP